MELKICSLLAFSYLYFYPGPQDVVRHRTLHGPVMGLWKVYKAGAMQDRESELLRIPLLRTSVNSAAKAHSSSRPDSRMVARFFLSFRAGSGGNHTETCAGCIVSLTTLAKSWLKASRSVSSRSLAEKASSVLVASYFLL